MRRKEKDFQVYTSTYKALGQESQLLLSLLLLTFLLPLRDRLLGRIPSSSSACDLLLRGILEN